MPTFEEHCKRCIAVMGEPFEEVHRWLDEFHGQPPWGTRHRRFRHHLEGIAEVRRMWGDEAARAAETHIRQDLDAEGWPGDWAIPANADEFQKSGLW